MVEWWLAWETHLLEEKLAPLPLGFLFLLFFLAMDF